MLKKLPEAVRYLCNKSIIRYSTLQLHIIGFSRRSSFDYGEGSKESEIVVLKERRLIPTKLVREGMQRFNFLLEVCVPGTVPDPQLIGAIMDLVRKLNANIIMRSNISIKIIA